MIGHGKFLGDPVEDALTRFKTTAYGGTPVDDTEAHALLADVGLVNVSTLSTPAGAPAIAAAQRRP
jgi:hypothetical protein